RDEPVEPRALGKASDRAGVATSGADLRNRLEVTFDDGDAEHRRERFQTRVIELDLRFEKRLRGGEQNHAHVEELASIHARDDADQRVAQSAALAHELRPPSIPAAMPACPSDTHDTRHDVPR